MTKKDIVLNVKKLHPEAIIPTKSYPYDSGYDLYALESVVLMPGETKLIKTGIAFDFPPGYEIQVRPRSGMSLKTKFRVANSPGTVDCGYNTDVSVIGYHSGSKDDSYIFIEKGSRVAQAVLCPIILPVLVEVSEFLSNTHRGSNGFGSTGA